MLPNRLLVATYVVRHLRLWALVRVALSGVFLLAGTHPLYVTPWGMCVVVGLCAAISVFEVRLRHEWVLLGNLGVDRVALSGLLLVPPFAGEFVVFGFGVLRG